MSTSMLSHDHPLLSSSLLIILTFLCVLLPSSSLQNNVPQGMAAMQEKIRLGSTPPNCHNRCNQCRPCWAVQVPTLPTWPGGPTTTRTRTRTQRGGAGPVVLEYDDQQQQGYVDQHSNYKPLGWKCRCGDRLYNP